MQGKIKYRPYLYQLGRAIAPTGTACKLSRTKHCNGALKTATTYKVLHGYQCCLQCNLLLVNINGTLSSTMYSLLNRRLNTSVLISLIAFTLIGPSFLSLMHHVMWEVTRLYHNNVCVSHTAALVSHRLIIGNK